MNKKTLIVIPGFTIGGTTSSLLALLPELENANVAVDVFCRSHIGPLKERFQKHKVLPENIWLSNVIVEGGLYKKALNFIVQNFRRFCFHLFRIDLYKLYGRIGGKEIHSADYDAVISFQEDLSRVIVGYPTHNRIAWIRAEYKRYIDETKRDEKALYAQFDKIVCVSQFAKDSFCSVYPHLENKTTVIHNVIAETEIRKLAKDDDTDHIFNTSEFVIVSIGRIDPVKQFDLIPTIASEIKSYTDKPFKWYIIGDGNKSVIDLLENNIKANHVEDQVILLGQKKNVYPYIVHSNLLVHTSKSETFSRVVNDAKALGTPVMINTYGCAAEFVNNGVDGLIVPIPLMGKKISELMNNDCILEVIKHNLSDFTTNNNLIVNQIKELL